MNRNGKKKIIGITASLTIICVLSAMSYFLFVPTFQIKNWKSEIERNVKESFAEEPIEICYGNVFWCETAEIELLNEEIDLSEIGDITLHYKISSHGKEKKLDQILHVVDHKAPTLEIEEKLIKRCPNGKLPDVKMKATDNVDGEITEKIEQKIEKDKIIFFVEDSSGNKTEKEIPSIIEDHEFPKISLNGNLTMYLSKNSIYEEPGFEVSDNCDDNLKEQVEMTNNINTSEAGEYHVTYKVKDSSNNETTKERMIYVYDTNQSENGEKVIYLTFDDGPSKYTNKLLDILKKYNVKATFFVTNQNVTKGYDGAIKRAYEEGHTIGLHSYSHDYQSIYQSEEEYMKDLLAIQKKVKDITGYEAKLIRFPGGSSNTISNFNPGVMTRLTKMVETKGFRYFDWNLDSNDSGSAKSATAVASNVIKGLGKGKRYIVLQHDIKEYSVDAVETIIQFGLSHGYSFQSLTVDSKDMHHKINN